MYKKTQKSIYKYVSFTNIEDSKFLRYAGRMMTVSTQISLYNSDSSGSGPEPKPTPPGPTPSSNIYRINLILFYKLIYRGFQ